MCYIQHITVQGRSKSKDRKNSATTALTSSSQVISYGTTNTYLKIVLMGDVKVGKTSLINRYINGVDGAFNTDQNPTVSCYCLQFVHHKNLLLYNLPQSCFFTAKKYRIIFSWFLTCFGDASHRICIEEMLAGSILVIITLYKAFLNIV